jgi:hypothetical protein
MTRRAVESDCTRLGELTSAQMFRRAVSFGAQARNTKSDYLRASYHRLALGYARLAGEREIEEQQPSNRPTVE